MFLSPLYDVGLFCFCSRLSRLATAAYVCLDFHPTRAAAEAGLGEGADVSGAKHRAG